MTWITEKGRSFLYVMVDDDLVKIGITNNLAKRLSDIRTARPTVTLACSFSVRTEQAKSAEKRAHEICAPARIAGEWFRIDVTLAIKAAHCAAYSC